MNEELTREVLEAMKRCKQNCTSCSANEVCSKHVLQEMIQSLAAALLEERAKPKVWDGAPKWVSSARVRFFINDRNDGHIEVFSRTYTRELPKTRVGWLLENPACPFRVCPLWDNDADGKCGGERHGGSAQESCLWYADYESALNKYAEELTNIKETN